MSLHYVQFIASDEAVICSEFDGPQDTSYYPFQGTVESEDPRYIAYLAVLNPPPNLLAIASAKLQQLTQLASAQKAALTNRIGTLNDAIELEMATPDEEAELPVRTAQLKAWKTYAVLLGRVTTQAGWYASVIWPTQPVAGMDLSVSAKAPETV